MPNRSHTLAAALAAVLAAAAACAPGSLAEPQGGFDPGGKGDQEGAADRSLGSDRDHLFDQLVAAIDSVQVVSDTGLARLGLTWPMALAVTRQRFRSASSARDVYYALLSLERSYHDIHSRLELGPGAVTVPDDPPLSLPVVFRAEFPAGPAGPASYVVSRVDDAGTGVVLGSTLEAVDGKPVREVEIALVEWLEGSSPEGLRLQVARWLALRRAAQLPVPAAGTPTRLRLAPPSSGPAYEVDLTWQPHRNRPPPDDPCMDGIDNPREEDYRGRQPELVGINFCVYPTSRPDTKIVRWFSFYYDAFAAPDALRTRMRSMTYAVADWELLQRQGGALDAIELSLLDVDQMMSLVVSQGITRLLVDVRENLGGNLDALWIAPFTGSFTQLATQVRYRPGLAVHPELLDAAEGGAYVPLARAYLLANPGAAASPLYPFMCQSQSCGPDELTVTGAEQPVAARLAVLAGPGCVSSCDNFVTMLRDNNLATLIGMPSSGGDSPARVPLALSLKDGQQFTLVLTVAVNFRPNGTVLEGNPPAPDVPVYPAAANRGGYLDAALAAVPW